jgi:hypothetical protein
MPLFRRNNRSQRTTILPTHNQSPPINGKQKSSGRSNRRRNRKATVPWYKRSEEIWLHRVALAFKLVALGLASVPFFRS